MPGWGTGSFENEDAQSFLRALSSKEPADLKSLLARAAESDYLNSQESSVVIVVGEVVASANGNPPETVPPQIAGFVQKIGGMPSSDLRELARKAIEQVRTNSELKDLWLEADGLNDWSTGLRELERRLS